MDIGDLGQLTTLGDGGEGVVFRASRVPGQVYKEYKASVAHELSVDGLEKTVALLERSPPAARQFVSERSAWPETLVTRNGNIAGFLMQEVPGHFWCEHGMAGRPRSGLTDWNKLVTRADWMDKQNIESTVPKFRVSNKADARSLHRVLLDLAQLFRHLHEAGIVVGDVSGQNILWTVRPEPRVFLIDCDGLRSEGERAVTISKQSPDWFDPLLNGDTNLDSDRYKLATAIYRAYFAEAFATPSSSAPTGGRIGSRIAALAAAGTGPSPRTSAQQWCELLEEIDDDRPRRLWSRRVPAPAANPGRNLDARPDRDWKRRG